MPSTTRLCHDEGELVLLVEGSDDCHVVMSLCNTYQVPQTFGIYECGSDSLVLKRLNALISADNRPNIIGVVLDADQSISTRWTGIQAKLIQHQYPFPAAPALEGTVLAGTHSTPTLGIWLMPNNQAIGMLEDFCLEMLDTNVRQFVVDSVARAQAEPGICTFKPAHLSKAVVHTYLAWQDEPGSPLGQAITQQSLRPQNATARMFVRWLGQLFNSQTGLTQ